MPERSRRRRKREKAPKAQKEPNAEGVRFISIWRRARPTPAATAAASGSPSRADSTPVRPGRAIAFLKRHAARKLPVYFHSPGGSEPDAIAIGRQLRQLGITVGVGATVPHGCASVRDTVGGVRRGEAVAAAGRGGMASRRHLQLRLRVGVARRQGPARAAGGPPWSPCRQDDADAASRPTAACSRFRPQEAVHKARTAEGIANARRYIREMGIDTALMDAALKIPHEDIRYLSRDEIAAFGIDRREFAETSLVFRAVFERRPRMSANGSSKPEAPERKDYRVSVVLLRCSSGSRASIAVYARAGERRDRAARGRHIFDSASRRPGWC